MAKVYLPIERGSKIVDLPPVCMKCGAPATVLKTKKFSWCPSWVGVLILVGVWPYIIVSLILTKRQTVETPLCDRHKNYWWLYPLLIGLAIVGVLGIGFFALIGVTANDHGRNAAGPLSWLGGLACLVSVVGLLGLIITAAIMGSMRIRTTEITDRYVKLAGVSPEFADAVEEDDIRQRSRFGRDDDYPREPRRQRDDDPRYTR